MATYICLLEQKVEENQLKLKHKCLLNIYECNAKNHVSEAILVRPPRSFMPHRSASEAEHFARHIVLT